MPRLARSGPKQPITKEDEEMTSSPESGAQPEPRAARPVAMTDAEWLYGDTCAGLRMRAAEELAAEFGTDVEEWLV